MQNVVMAGGCLLLLVDVVLMMGMFDWCHSPVPKLVALYVQSLLYSLQTVTSSPPETGHIITD